MPFLIENFTENSILFREVEHELSMWRSITSKAWVPLFPLGYEEEIVCFCYVFFPLLLIIHGALLRLNKHKQTNVNEETNTESINDGRTRKRQRKQQQQ
jgi:hypothetical protein